LTNAIFLDFGNYGYFKINVNKRPYFFS